MSLLLTPLPARPANWDDTIREFDSKTLFHESGWLDHVLSITPRSRVDYLVISVDGQPVGYFCALRIRKLMLTVYGSPLPGTGTNYMGPVVSSDVSQREVVAALLQYCRAQGVAHLELAHPMLSVEDMSALGMDVHSGVTHVVRLPQDEAAGFALLKSSCRNRVRKAEKNGLVAEVTDDESIVDRFFEQFIEVYGKQGMHVPFDIERPRSLFRSLYARGRLLPVWVKNNEEVIAAGLFPFDEHAIYFWGAASWLKDQHLCPNELLHWTVMREAIRREIPLYNMCGGQSQFKDKFGGEDIPYYHFSHSFLPGLRKARDLYRAMHWQRLRVLDRLRRITSRKSFPAEAEPTLQLALSTYA